MEDNFNPISHEHHKDTEVVRLINPKQVYFYLKNNVFPLWLEAGFNERIVYVFEKEPTLKLFALWRNHEVDKGRLW